MGKVYRHLYPQITDWENLLLAWHKARKGKRGQPPAARFEMEAGENLLLIQEELANGTYRPGPYVSFHIHEPKRRLISAAPFRDRVVHHALCNVIEPIFERRFIHDSYANRAGKGTHAALDRSQAYARRYAYVLPCDGLGGGPRPGPGRAVSRLGLDAGAQSGTAYFRRGPFREAWTTTHRNPMLLFLFLGLFLLREEAIDPALQQRSRGFGVATEKFDFSEKVYWSGRC